MVLADRDQNPKQANFAVSRYMSDTMQSNEVNAQSLRDPTPRWTGLGHWNFYFLIKLLLFWGGYLQFDVFYNLIFVAALLFPLGHGWLNKARHIIAIPFGIALLYRDSWYPPIDRLLAQPEVLDFSFWYLLELLERFINWQMVGAGFIALVVYLYVYQWLRLTTITVVVLAAIAMNQYVTLPAWITQPAITTLAQAQRTMPQPQGGLPAGNNGAMPTVVPQGPATAGKPTDDILNAYLSDFYQKESLRRVNFPQTTSGPPFDILVISICSLAWSDLAAVDMTLHPIFKDMDVIFDNFSSSTSYSGPAVLRMLRANCGQTPHPELYRQGDAACYLFQTLNTLGFKSEAALNHDGKFQGFLDEIRTNGNLPVPYIPTQMRPSLTGFDGSPIWDDYSTLNNWWQKRVDDKTERVALLYNTITLHDGNREARADGGGRTAPYRPRAEKLLDGIMQFMREVEQSGRRAMLIFIPEHGAALKADKMQIAGMREVPTFDLTHVPVGVKLIGTQDKAPANPVHVTGPTSFLALSDLIARVLQEDVFAQSRINWDALVQGLPLTEAINENEGTIVMHYQNTPFIRLGGRNWIEYPR